MVYLPAIKEINISISELVIMIIILTIIISFSLLAYQSFIKRIIREKSIQYEQEIRHQKDFLQQQVKIQEDERERIAVLLHDDIGNRLNILSVWLHNPESWNSRRSQEIILAQIPELIDATRSISHSLYPINLERFGLLLSLEEMLSGMSPSLHTRLITTHPYQNRPVVVEVQLYRIIQEFMTNVIKHAEASAVKVHLRDSEGSLSVLLSDNGKGFDTGLSGKGMGLRNITLRLRSLNASYKWKSTKRQGSRLIFIIPKP